VCCSVHAKEKTFRVEKQQGELAEQRQWVCVLKCVKVCCSGLQWVAVGCSELQWVAVHAIAL